MRIGTQSDVGENGRDAEISFSRFDAATQRSHYFPSRGLDRPSLMLEHEDNERGTDFVAVVSDANFTAAVIIKLHNFGFSPVETE